MLVHQTNEKTLLVAAVDLFELADFILGWFGLDIAKDDKPLPKQQEKEAIKL